MLDLQALLLASAAARIGFILIFMVESFRSEARLAFRFWTASVFSSTVGLLLLYQDPQYPYLPADRGAVIYGIFGFSLACFWAGGRLFFGRAVHWLRFAIAGAIPGLTYGTAHSLGCRPGLVLLLALATMVLTTAHGAQPYLVRSGRRYLPSQLLVGLAMASYSLVMAGSVLLLSLEILSPGMLPGDPMSQIAPAVFIDQFMSVLTYVGLIAMSLEHIQSRIKELAILDPLTGLANRRGVQEGAAALIAACQRAGRPMAVLIADIDHFKSVNDRYGHNSGDAVLREFGRRLVALSRREQDVVGRWGGEEFLLVLDDMSLRDATVFAERLRQQVAEVPFDIGDQSITVTVSIGIAWIDIPPPPLEQAVRRADAALYDAKRGGRNRVQTAAPLPRPAPSEQPPWPREAGPTADP